MRPYYALELFLLFIWNNCLRWVVVSLFFTFLFCCVIPYGYIFYRNYPTLTFPPVPENAVELENSDTECISLEGGSEVCRRVKVVRVRSADKDVAEFYTDLGMDCQKAYHSSLCAIPGCRYLHYSCSEQANDQRSVWIIVEKDRESTIPMSELRITVSRQKYNYAEFAEDLFDLIFGPCC